MTTSASNRLPTSSFHPVWFRNNIYPPLLHPLRLVPEPHSVFEVRTQLLAHDDQRSGAARSGGLVDDSVSDLDGMVSKALVVAAEQRHIDCRGAFAHRVRRKQVRHNPVHNQRRFGEQR
jgi:hypothetical protein